MLMGCLPIVVMFETPSPSGTVHWLSSCQFAVMIGLNEMVQLLGERLLRLLLREQHRRRRDQQHGAPPRLEPPGESHRRFGEGM